MPATGVGNSLGALGLIVLAFVAGRRASSAGLVGIGVVVVAGNAWWVMVLCRSLSGKGSDHHDRQAASAPTSSALVSDSRRDRAHSFVLTLRLAHGSSTWPPGYSRDADRGGRRLTRQSGKVRMHSSSRTSSRRSSRVSPAPAADGRQTGQATPGEASLRDSVMAARPRLISTGGPAPIPDRDRRSAVARPTLRGTRGRPFRCARAPWCGAAADRRDTLRYARDRPCAKARGRRADTPDETSGARVRQEPWP